MRHFISTYFAKSLTGSVPDFIVNVSEIIIMNTDRERNINNEQ